MLNVLYKYLLVALMLPALGLACGDYCDYGGEYDYGWAGVYETGGSNLYQSAYDIYNTTLEVDITTTTYAPIYDYSMDYGGGCGSLISTCGGGYDSPNLWNDPYGMSGNTYPNFNQVPRDPNQPLPLDPYNPYANGSPMPPGGGYIPRDPAVLPPGPIGMYPQTPALPPTMYPLPPVYPQNPIWPNAIPSFPMTPPIGTNVPRDPRTPYTPPTPPTWGGCDGVIVPCPGGPIVRPQTSGNPPGGSTLTNPTVSNTFSPSTLSPSTAPTRNQVPRGAHR